MCITVCADYRLDSDVPVTYYTRWEYPDLKAMPVPFAKKREDGLVAVFISNCGPRNDREEVLAKLIKVRVRASHQLLHGLMSMLTVLLVCCDPHMQLLPGLVHSYGGCQHNKDTSDSKQAVCM